MKRYKTLILNGKAVKKLIGMREAMRVVEKVFGFFGKGMVQMPPKVYLHLDKHNGDFRAMPTYVEGLNACSIKWVNVHPGNRKKGLPTVMAIIILSDPRNGFPLLKLEWLKKGVHINAIGADAKGKQELDWRILKKAKIVVDAWEQASHSGEINVPLRKGLLKRGDIRADIGEVVKGKRIRSGYADLTVFDSTGIAIQDTAAATAIYKKALRLKKGRYVGLV